MLTIGTVLSAALVLCKMVAHYPETAPGGEVGGAPCTTRCAHTSEGMRKTPCCLVEGQVKVTVALRLEHMKMGPKCATDQVSSQNW